MPYSEQEKDTIFAKTDGWCHICRKPLKRENYAAEGKPGAWEVEHSKPRADGGTDHPNNRFPACIACNRSKGAGSTRAARAKHGFRAAPLSRAKKRRNAVGWGIAGGIAGGIAEGVAVRMLFAPLSPAGIIAGVGVGALLGYYHQPK